MGQRVSCSSEHQTAANSWIRKGLGRAIDRSRPEGRALRSCLEWRVSGGVLPDVVDIEWRRRRLVHRVGDHLRAPSRILDRRVAGSDDHPGACDCDRRVG
jgi:hypothetical protein